MNMTAVLKATATAPAFLNTVLHRRRLIVVLLHVVLIVVANLTALLLRFDLSVPPLYADMALQMLPWLVGVRLLTLWPFRLFEGLWKYTSLWDLRNIVLAVTLSTVFFYGLTELINDNGARYPLSIFIIDSVLLICLMSAVRLTSRVYRELLRPIRGRRVLVFGAGDAGEMIVRDMRQNEAFDAQPIGFIDDDPRKVGVRIHGIPVLGTRATLPRILEQYNPDEVLIAIPSAQRETLREIVRVLTPFKVRITTLPRLADLLGQRIDVHQIRQLRVEDLLSRDPIGLDVELVTGFIAGKRVLVTGAGGSIGSELCRQIAAANPSSLLMLDRYENTLFHVHHELAELHPDLALQSIIADVTDARRVDQLLREARPNIIFHAAAHKHVPLMEQNPCEAVKNNVRGTRVVAEAAIKWGVDRFVMVSSDKAVNPTSVMGATKRIAELIVSYLHGRERTRFLTVRFGNVLGSNGSVVPRFLSQIAKGGPVTVTHPDMRRYFMLIPEAVQLVLCAAAADDGAPIYVLDMGEQVKLVDLARDLIRLSGLVPDKDIAIEYSGIRPGEKLFEELVGEHELAEPSSMPKVLRLHVAAAHAVRPSFMESVTHLETLAQDGEADEALMKMCRIVPEFRPTDRPVSLRTA
jgi:FlaA1/EpsC-like NDP-sugar epimerase